MTITEDDLTNAVIKEEKESSIYKQVHCYPEVHYNHYGTRGVVDLYRFYEDPSKPPFPKSKGIVTEFKSKAAIQNATGANEIIRQFNKMVEAFYKGSSHHVPESVIYHLCFSASNSILQHILDNKEMYAAASAKSEKEKYDIMILMRHPKDEKNITIFRNGRERLPSRSLNDIENRCPSLFNKCTSVIREWVKRTN